MIERLRRRIAAGERQGGFTLIELLVVIVIIGVLLAIAVPSYLGFKDRAEQRTAESNIRAAIPSVEAYYSDNGTYATPAMDLAALQAYDAGISDLVVVDNGDVDSYCIEITYNGNTAHFAGPGGDVLSGLC
jgi:type IV pilus assembly protein PilA